jgi:threonine dehydrogenase-like Zn-dependent dehydrogenase
MRAVRNTARGIEVVEVDEPAGPGGDGVVVRVASAGICGSDLHLLGWGPMPVTLGHEVAGRLDDGTPVAVWPARPCRACDRCAAGEPQQCRTGAARTYGVGSDGGMADALVVDAANVLPLPDGVTPADACLAEPIACSVHALRRAGLTAGDRVAVVGAGAIGLGAAAVARWKGCAVDVAGRHAAQHRAARAIGAGTELDGEYDVVVDAAGTSASIASCVDLVRPGGTVVVVSTPWDPMQFPALFSFKEPTFVTAQMHGDDRASDMADALRLLADLTEVPAAVITHRFPLARASEAFAAAADRAAGAIKVVLEP